MKGNGTAGLARWARELPRTVLIGLRNIAVGADPAPSGPPRRLGTWRVLLLVLTVPLAGLNWAVIIGAMYVKGGWVIALTILHTAPLVFAARRPLLGWRIGYLSVALSPIVLRTPWGGGWPWNPVEVPVFLAIYCVAGLRHPRVTLWAMWALTVPVLWIWVADPSNAAGGSVVLTLLTIVVDSLGGRRRAQRALTEETERTELEKARRAILEERTRIARELHDVVAHHMSLIVVQAETAPYRLDDVSEGAGREFGDISAKAREALREMRRLLGVLRSDSAVERAPQPGLDDLDRLVDGARRAGVTVELSTVDGDRPVPDTVGVCGYRVVQEALSNATRHAPGAPVTIELRHDPDAVRLRIGNGPPVRPAPAGRAAPETWPAAGTSAPGHGLTGMRERVAALGGTLSAGPTDGGFLVVAVLPLQVDGQPDPATAGPVPGAGTEPPR